MAGLDDRRRRTPFLDSANIPHHFCGEPPSFARDKAEAVDWPRLSLSVDDRDFESRRFGTRRSSSSGVSRRRDSWRSSKPGLDGQACLVAGGPGGGDDLSRQLGLCTGSRRRYADWPLSNFLRSAPGHARARAAAEIAEERTDGQHLPLARRCRARFDVRARARLEQERLSLRRGHVVRRDGCSSCPSAFEYVLKRSPIERVKSLSVDENDHRTSCNDGVEYRSNCQRCRLGSSLSAVLASAIGTVTISSGYLARGSGSFSKPLRQIEF